MRFHVSHELRQPAGTVFRYELQERRLALEDDIVLRELKGTMELVRTDRGLLVHVAAGCLAHGVCARCLTEIDYRLRLDFEEEYLPVLDIFTGLPNRIPRDTDQFLIDADFVLDLREALRQYTVMAEPLNPLCRPDCRGLCPDCGQNLNEGPCACPERLDSRWEPLRRLAARLRQEE
jgi:uncharacterized protein